jgi:hypothetical protein
MNEDDKMCYLGIGLLVPAVVLTLALQVFYRNQDRARANVRREIVRTQQEAAVASANFASYVRPEILRNLVAGIYPKAEVISFNKSVSIDELPARE